jgi:hypothetical protein
VIPGRPPLGVGGQLPEPPRGRLGLGWRFRYGQPGTAAADIDGRGRQLGAVDGKDAIPYQPFLVAAQAAPEGSAGIPRRGHRRSHPAVMCP